MSCGADNVSVVLVYVPVGTLVKLSGTEKSIRQAKSTVTGVLDDSTETAAPPPSGVRVMPVIVTENDTTSQTGASPPKTTVEPVLVGCVLVVRLDDEFPPEPLTMTASAASETTSNPFFANLVLMKSPSRGCRVCVTTSDFAFSATENQSLALWKKAKNRAFTQTLSPERKLGLLTGRIKVFLH
jgi:hypothetical protein